MVELETHTQEFYLSLAAKMRIAAAERFMDLEYRKEMLDLANRYDVLAEHAAQRRKAAA